MKTSKEWMKELRKRIARERQIDTKRLFWDGDRLIQSNGDQKDIYLLTVDKKRKLIVKRAPDHNKQAAVAQVFGRHN